MPLRLPPLPALRLFEAAGRHQSFKLAAEELSLTPSAVSHGVVALERALGVTLFERATRKLTLTPAGADYLAYVSEAFSLIAIGTERLPSRHARREIRVSCAPTLASRWLLPRLHRFTGPRPNVHVSVDTSHRVMTFPVDGFDFALRRAQGVPPGKGWTRLFGERLFPVRAPGYRPDLVDADGAIDLSRVTPIHVTTVGEDWRTWRDAVGGPMPDLEDGMRVDTVQLAQEACAAGLGVAIARLPLVEAELAAGTLVPARPERIDTDGVYWLVASEGAEHRPELVAFAGWLLGEAAETAARLADHG